MTTPSPEPTTDPTPEALEITNSLFLSWNARCQLAQRIDAFAQAAVEGERERCWQIVLHEAKYWPATDDVQSPFVNIYKAIREVRS